MRAASAPPEAIALGCEGVVKAGERITLSWPEMPADTREFELLLLCEAPLTLKVRLTESRSPDQTGFTWQAPAFPATRARLLLRRGGAEGETTWARSAAFEIRSERGQQLQRVAWRAGELWLSHEKSPLALEASLPPALREGNGTLPRGALPAPGDELPPPEACRGSAPPFRRVNGLSRPAHAPPRSAPPLTIPLRM